jgi:hypothetical protein
VRTLVDWLLLWFVPRDPVSRRAYLLSGLGLAAFKVAVEAVVTWWLTGRSLTLAGVVSPSFAVREAAMQGAPEWFGWALFLWSVPFIWIALSMSVRRAASAGVWPWLGAVVLLPGVNWLAMLALAWLPDQPGVAPPPATGAPPPSSTLVDLAALRAVGAALATGGLAFAVSLYAFRSYGAVLFFGTPLVMGMVAGFLFTRPVPKTAGATVRLGVGVMAVAGGVLLAFAFEGLICLAMAAPIVMPLAIAGTVLGKWIAEATPATLGHALPLILALPLVAGAEALSTAAPERCVLTTVEIDAPPEAVWPHVVSFPDLPEPDDWFFRSGIACPLRARIEGTGVGAIRHCEFTTGDFVEPITVWDQPRRLAFDVREQPDPMVELSPWRHVHPPHMHDRSLTSRRGEFRLVPLPGGRTRLEGRTWYTFDMHPQAYWTLWSELAIHKIHRRVLAHIARLAERH